MVIAFLVVSVVLQISVLGAVLSIRKAVVKLAA
jgi:hypothetical protein